MANPVKIEWSGFWDFPAGEYSGGSKDGDSRSGEFNARHIILNSISGIEYEIDAGKIGFPTSPECSFSLKNKDPDTGEQRYPFAHLTSLGRTEEYGGNLAEFGNLFVRITIPDLNNKTVFKGVVEDFEYSERDRQVTINCTDFPRIIKGMKRRMFYNHELKQCTVSAIDGNTNSIATDIAGFTIGNFTNFNGKNLNIEKLSFLVEDISDCALNFAEGFSCGGNIGSVFGVSIDSYAPGDPPIDKVNAYIEEKRDIINARFRGRDFVHRYMAVNPVFSGFDGDDDTETDTISSGWRPTFVKIEDSTILTMMKFRFESKVFCRIGEGDTVLVDGIDWRYFIDIVHFNNGESGTIRVNGEDLIVLERGRFYKKANNVSEATIVGGDELTVNIIDYPKGIEPLGSVIFETIISSGFGNYGVNGGTNVPTSIFIGGILFDATSSNNSMITREFAGYFNNFLSLVDMVNNNLLTEYTLGFSSDNIFDTSGALENLHQHCYVSDIIHYGWGDKDVVDLIVDVARQIGAFLYSNEQGRISFLSRDIRFEDVEDVSIEIFPEDYDIISPTKYRYGSRYYSIQYSDRIELNNLSGSDKVELNLNSRGEVVTTIIKPQDIAVANFRTSDLGVPDGDELNTFAKRLRRSIIRENGGVSPDFFLMHPVEQASLIARTIGYPSEVFTIALDVKHGEDKGYYGIGIGSILVEKDVSTKTYLVKNVSYNVDEIFRNSASLKLTLLEFKTYPPVREEIEEVFTIDEFQEDEFLEGIFESFSETFNINELTDEDIIEAIRENYSEEIVIQEFDSDEVTSPPNTPTNVTASNINGVTYVNVDWSYSGSNPDNFILERNRNSEGFFVVSSSISGSSRSFTDVGSPGGFSVGDTVRYRMKAVSNGIESSYSFQSNQVTVNS